MLPAAAGDGWIAVGDPATSFDPLTSTGVHNALRTAAEAVAVIAGGGDGAEYARARRRDFGEFLVERAQVYGEQVRFDTTFWRRRRLETMLVTAESVVR